MAKSDERARGTKRPELSQGAAGSSPKTPVTSQRPLVVGIGASAGGLEAFKSFFAKMPPNAGMAFVLVQHLDPNHRSILAELIARQTTMVVREALDGAPILPNTVFVIPPDATLTISDGRLRVERPAPPRQTRFPIDTFFTSLAESLGEDAVGIILAGTGSDGTAGVRAIKAQGGLTLAQAGFDHLALTGMPQSAAATGLVDHVMLAEDMPAQLLEYARHLQGVACLKDDDGARRDMEGHLSTISSLLHAAIGHDFGQYKQSTIARRVQRRMQVLHIENVPMFIERLRKDPPQLDLLFREFLIGVTQFFRDPDAYEALRTKGLSALFDANQSDPIRIWVPACATGEEVYSIAILLNEEMERRGVSRQVQIFGTDIDDGAVAVARSAYYPRTMVGMSPERVGRWFSPRGDGYCVLKKIREMCIFSVHSIIKDPPFSKLDLISCRNLMIYFDAGLQDKVVCSFHYALKPGGILFLGPSEGLTRGPKLFGLLDKRHRIFERRHADTRTRLPNFSSPEFGTQPSPAPAAAQTGAFHEDRIERNVRNVLEKHSPAYIVIDGQYDVVRFSGGAVGRYLEPAGGPPNLNLFSLLRKTLRPVVRTAVQKAFSEGCSVVQEQISIRLDGASCFLTLIVEPLSGARGGAELCVVAFQDLGVAKIGSVKRNGRPPEIAAIDRELQTAKAQLMDATADLEAAREEAASVAEEHQSVNEELQSSNEELETAKEEMQSINEELQTVNAELNSKNDQLLRANSDLQNLLDSTEIATIFLDAELRVKGYTPAMTELFHIRDADRGRPLFEIVSRITYGDLRDDVTRVLRDLRTIEREVEIARGGATFIMRMRPYRRLDRVIDGVVITFVDISVRKAMEEVLREHAAIVEFSQDALISMTVDGVVRSWNPGAERIFGYSASKAVGRQSEALFNGADQLKALIDQAKSGKIVHPVNMNCVSKNGGQVFVELAVMPIRASDGAVAALAMSARDVAERVEGERQRALLLQELSHRVKNALATVQAIAFQTLKWSATPEAFAAAFSARLMALAQTHDLLTRREWKGALLRDVIEAELAPFQDEASTRWRCTGPAVMLPAQAALAFGLAFHELATNAAKYGALSDGKGRVEVSWTEHNEKGGRKLHLDWVEAGGPPVEKPSRKGFGTLLVGDALGDQLDGDVALSFEAAGVRCSIDASLVDPRSTA